MIDAEINAILEEGKARAAQVLTEHRAELDELVKVLLAKETVEQEEFNEIMGIVIKKADDAGPGVEVMD